MVDISHIATQTLFEGLSGRHGFYWLDSQPGDYSYMGFDPIDTCHHGNLMDRLGQYTAFIPQGDPPPYFTGGFVGFLSYNYTQSNSVEFPASMFGVYNKTVVIDHTNNKKYWIHTPAPGCPKITSIESLFVPYASSFKTSPIHSDWQYEQYQDAFATIIDHIQRGNVYQVNLSHRFHMDYAGNPAALYAKLRAQSPAPFGCYIHMDPWVICSASPERFFKQSGGQIVTQPIKGTAPRGHTPAQDRAAKAALLASEKNKAELLMITDLLRNDLAMVCQTGSVTVDALRTVHAFSNVFHTESVIRGATSAPIADILKTLSPGGSITGAPKQAAMALIDELETAPRGLYTGSIGLIRFDQQLADFNIAIRTLYGTQSRLYFHSGGGIVADSTPQSEYEELLKKAESMAQVVDRL